MSTCFQLLLNNIIYFVHRNTNFIIVTDFKIDFHCTTLANK